MERQNILTKKDLNKIEEIKRSYRYRAEYHWVDPTLNFRNIPYDIKDRETVLGYGDDKDELIRSIIEEDPRYEYDSSINGSTYFSLEEPTRKFTVIENHRWHYETRYEID